MSVSHIISSSEPRKNIYADTLTANTFNVTTLTTTNLEVTGDALIDGKMEVKGNSQLDGTLETKGIATFDVGAKFGVTGTPVGYTPSTITVAQTNASLAANASGPWAAPTAVNFGITKIGNVVTIQLAAYSAASTTASLIGFSANLPAWLWPSVGVSIPIAVISNSVTEIGYAGISEIDGSIIFSRTTGTFANTGTAGWRGFSVSYRTT